MTFDYFGFPIFARLLRAEEVVARDVLEARDRWAKVARSTKVRAGRRSK